ncbi:phospholipase A2 [Williamsia sterculiae]|uniref:Phospholipase A2 n=1 Tax=Williamsia sterculiae TaxID=1344003 RepID=A0A1N7H3D2_9NOCA|nr:phospholipase A2 [Williamsia sterculiae]SIS19270.1 phospholipase A2 [Williamsia sterculiae]
MTRLRVAVATLVLVVFAVLGGQATAHATPTEQYPIDPAAQAASQVYPGPPVSARSRSATAAAFVSVPSNYVYDTNLVPVARHDYCTSSPDSYFAADFRGPCARHDLCYDRADTAGTDYTACNSALRTDLKTNCAYAYGSGTALTTCKATADVYWAAVTATHL